MPEILTFVYSRRHKDFLECLLDIFSSNFKFRVGDTQSGGYNAVHKIFDYAIVADNSA